ncbi:MAG: NAD(+) synthase [Clostridia bacterium]|nr:NAD(+) synthase [Clostridia bacterium]
MQYGFIKTAALAPKMRVADPEFNARSAIDAVKAAAKQGVELVVLPRLFLTGCTCGGLFNTVSLLKKAEDALLTLAVQTASLNCATVVGLPVSYRGRLLDCSAVVCGGEVVGLTCAQNPDAPFCEGVEGYASIGGTQVPLSPDTVYRCRGSQLSFCIEIGEVLSTLAPLTLHLEGTAETVSAHSRRISAALSRTRQSGGALVCCCTGADESTTDFVYSGAQLIAERGVMLAESKPFGAAAAVSEIDCELISRTCLCPAETLELEFELDLSLEGKLTRRIEKDPFMPSYADKDDTCRMILELQARGLARRMEHTGAKAVVLGISGGLDSTLALLVAVRACRILGKPVDTVQAVTMPCFGTSKRTKTNAEKLCEQLSVPLRQVNITAAVERHFRDIGHDGVTTDAAFENSQARERTQVLMDLANMLGGFVIGTGDLSELALGWATYNGDHMSAYAVNADVPKTTIRHVVEYCAKMSEDPALSETLRDIIGTPVSPELLPLTGKESDQKTEDIVGPYELHDFYLYNLLKNGYTPQKIGWLAKQAFEGEYSAETVDKWLSTFMRRFVSQQFKRSCMPDGPAVFDFSLSPRAGFNFPSDASGAVLKY